MLSRVKALAIDVAARELAKRGRAVTRPRFHEDHSIDLRAVLAEPIQRQEGELVVLQIGANDGVSDDPIHEAVVSRGWTLYAVEPMPGAFARLQETYAAHERVHPINCAVGTETTIADIYFLEPAPGEAPSGLDVYASFSRDMVESHWRSVPNAKRRIRAQPVPVHTVPSLVATFGIPRVDMLQIDTEGFDYEVLKMCFADGLLPPVIAFEWVHLSQDDMWSCRNDLIEHGYRWLLDKGDVIATRSV